MRVFVFICVCFCVANGQEERMARMPKYDERYDYLDVDALFNSKRLVRNYVDCLINAQRCTPEGKQLKRVLPEALRTKCARCTERQKKTAVKVIRRLKMEFPDEWAKVSSRWDPTGDFTRYFEEFLAKEHFNTIYGSAGNNDIAGPSPLPDIPAIPPRLPVMPPSTARPSTEAPASFPNPVILNRFGDESEVMMGSPSSAAVTPRPTTTRPPISPNTFRPPPPPPPSIPSRSYFLRYLQRLLHACIAGQQNRQPARYSLPTQMTWMQAGSDAIPTRFPLRPTNDIPQPFTTAITFIDQIGYKIIRTTELVTDILKNTVRAVVGR